MPDGWRKVPLREVMTLDCHQIGVDPSASYDLAGVYSFGRGLFEREPLRGSATAYKRLNHLSVGQFVMSKLKAWEGAIAVVSEEFDGHVLSPEFPTFSLGPDLLPDYLALICSRSAFWLQLQQESAGMGGRRERVHPNRLLSLAIDVPPVPTQRRIVDLVRAIDNVIDRSQTLSGAAWDLAGAVLDDHEQDLAGDATKLSDLLASTVGGIWGLEPGADDTDVRVVRSTEFRNDGRLVTSNGVVRSVSARQLAGRQLTAGDILLEKSGGGPKQPVGRVVFVEQPDNPTVCANFVQLVRPDRARVNPRYLFFRMWNWHRTGRTLGYQSQTTGIRNLRTKDYLSQSLVVPAVDQQSVLVSLIEAIVEVAHLAAANAAAGSNARLSLLADLLSGDHSIPESYDVRLESA